MNRARKLVFGTWSTLRSGDRLLASAAVLCFVLLLPAALALAVDPRALDGESLWGKPLRFLLAFGVYLATLAWLLGALPAAERLRRVVSRGAASVAALEIALICFQSARGRASHFNLATSFDETIYRLMGAGVVVNTVLMVVLFLRLWRDDVRLPYPILLGVRAGLALFIVGSLEGIVMAIHGGHGVGTDAADPGLPGLGWSTTGGDLRIAHFLGLHALQALPLAGAVVHRVGSGWPRAGRSAAVLLAGLAYGAAVVASFVQALAGEPLPFLFSLSSGGSS